MEKSGEGGTLKSWPYEGVSKSFRNKQQQK